MLTVFTTSPTDDEARSLAQKLVSEHLAGCVQILPNLTSVYMWNDEIQTEPEYLLIIKTLPEKWENVQALINREHSYDVPEIVGLESRFISDKYSEWLNSVVQ
jgi:periplasmic divalent cation tolerance protein